MPINFLYFDFGNVLCTFSHEAMCEQLAEAFGTSVENVHKTLFGGDLQFRFEAGQLSLMEYYQQLCQKWYVKPPLEAFKLAANDIFEPIEPMFAMIDSLAKAGKRLGVLSNTNECHWNFVTDGRYSPWLPDCFDTIVLSYEERSMKPDAKIYEAAIQRVNLPPDEIFFTDDREENVEGALQAGLDAVLFTGKEQLAGDLTKRGIDT